MSGERKTFYLNDLDSKSRKRKMKKRTYKIISTVLLLTAVLSIGAVVLYRINLKQSVDQFSDLSAMRSSIMAEEETESEPPEQILATESAQSDEQSEDQSDEKAEPGSALPESDLAVKNWFLKLSLMNGDIAAWLKCDQANIDFPVMYTPKRPTYYLRRNFNKDYAISGTPFFDYRTAPDSAATSALHLIYSHNMGDGTMFSHLLDYDTVESIEAADEIILDTAKGKRVYQVFAAVKLQEYSALADRFYNVLSFKDRRQFESYIDFLKRVAVTSPTLNPLYGDDVLVLSTCSKHIDRGRFALVAIHQKPEKTEE